MLVLAAAGPTFCSGHDLKEMAAHRSDVDSGRVRFAEIFAQCSKLMQSIVRHPVPVIAEVQGVATAAGCQLVASCDLAVAFDRGALRHSRGKHRAFLFDSDGSAVAKCLAQARDGNVAHRRSHQRRGCSPNRSDQPHRRAAYARRRNDETCPRNCREAETNRPIRQGRILPPARNATCGCVRLHERSDDDEHARGRIRGKALELFSRNAHPAGRSEGARDQE